MAKHTGIRMTGLPRGAGAVVLACLLSFACRTPPAEESAPEPAQDEPRAAKPAKAPPKDSAAEERRQALSWAIQSPGGEWIVRQTPLEGAECRLECTRAPSSEVSWENPACVARRDQLRFLAPDGERVLVVEPSPKIDEHPIPEVELAWVYRRGNLEKKLRAREFSRIEEMEIRDGRIAWIATAVNGLQVRQAEDSVELWLLGGRRALVRFDGAITFVAAPVLEAPPPKEPVVEDRCSPHEPCSYVDEFGVYHLVESGDQIPDRYRRRASRLDGEGVTVIDSPLENYPVVPEQDESQDFAQPPPPAELHAGDGREELPVIRPRGAEAPTPPAQPPPAQPIGNVLERTMRFNAIPWPSAAPAAQGEPVVEAQ